MENKKINKIINVIAMAVLLCAAVFSMRIVNGHCKYMRLAAVVSKHETGHDHKGIHYADYYLTVRFTDRDMEQETFECSGETFVQVGAGEAWSFKRPKPEWEWYVYGWAPIIIMLLWMMFVLSVGIYLTKILKDDENEHTK